MRSLKNTTGQVNTTTGSSVTQFMRRMVQKSSVSRRSSFLAAAGSPPRAQDSCVTGSLKGVEEGQLVFVIMADYMDYDLDATDIAAAQVFFSASSVPAAHVSKRMLFASMLPPHLDIQSAGWRRYQPQSIPVLGANAGCLHQNAGRLTYTQTHKRARTHTHTHTQPHTLTHNKYKHTHTHPPTLKHIYTHAHSRTHTHTHTHTRTQTYSHPHLHAHTHAHTHTHTHALMHAHSPTCMLLETCSCGRRSAHGHECIVE